MRIKQTKKGPERDGNFFMMRFIIQRQKGGEREKEDLFYQEEISAPCAPSHREITRIEGDSRLLNNEVCGKNVRVRARLGRE